MHSESDGLRLIGLQIADAAMLAVQRAKRCAVCEKPRPPKGLYKYDQVATWADEMNAVDGTPVIQLPHDERCSMCEAELKAVVGIPDDILLFMHRKMSEAQKAFLVTRFVLAMCETCRKVNRHTTDRSVRALYKKAVKPKGVDVDDHGLAGEIFGLVAREVELAKQGYGV